MLYFPYYLLFLGAALFLLEKLSNAFFGAQENMDKFYKLVVQSEVMMQDVPRSKDEKLTVVTKVQKSDGTFSWANERAMQKFFSQRRNGFAFSYFFCQVSFSFVNGLQFNVQVFSFLACLLPYFCSSTCYSMMDLGLRAKTTQKIFSSISSWIPTLLPAHPFLVMSMDISTNVPGLPYTFSVPLRSWQASFPWYTSFAVGMGSIG
jgi:hypothetical protein